MSERDQFLCNAILKNMTEEQKDHYYNLLQSQDKGVRSFQEGRLITIPAIEIKFIEVGQIHLGHGLPPEAHG